MHLNENMFNCTDATVLMIYSKIKLWSIECYDKISHFFPYLLRTMFFLYFANSILSATTKRSSQSNKLLKCQNHHRPNEISTFFHCDIIKRWVHWIVNIDNVILIVQSMVYAKGILKNWDLFLNWLVNALSDYCSIIQCNILQ